MSLQSTQKARELNSKQHGGRHTTRERRGAWEKVENRSNE